jgi:hypothetical protein
MIHRQDHLSWCYPEHLEPGILFEKNSVFRTRS